MKIKKNQTTITAMIVVVTAFIVVTVFYTTTIRPEVVLAKEAEKAARLAENVADTSEKLEFEHKAGDCYHLLTANEQVVYDAIVANIVAALNGEEYSLIFNFDFEYSNVDMSNVWHALEYDCSYLLWWGQSVVFERIEYGNSFSLELKSAYVENGKITDESLQKAATALAKAKKLAKIVEDKSVKTQLELFSGFVANSTEYNDYVGSHYYEDSYFVNTAKTFISVFDGDDEKTSICTGYASAFQLLCHLNGIECYRVYGYVNNETNGHTWNKVVLDGEEYFFDITSADTGYGVDLAYIMISITGKNRYTFTDGEWVEKNLVVVN